MPTVRSLLSALALTAAIAACTGEPSTQVLTGRVDASKGAVAIRAISGGDVITAGQVRSDGSFTLVLPVGTGYRLELLTRDGVKNIAAPDGASGLRDLTFNICEPVDPFDVGEIDDPGESGGGMSDPGDPECKDDCVADGTCPKPCDPTTDQDCPKPPQPEPCDWTSDPNCPKPEPQPCDWTSDPNCPKPCDPYSDPECPKPEPCDASTDPMCPPQPCSDWMDPNCNPPPPPKCDPTTDQNCPPPPKCEPGDPSCMGCDPWTDPSCTCDEWGNCTGTPGGCTDPYDPDCMPPKCDENGNCEQPCSDPNEPGCAPPCVDPMDPTSCKDPCLADPMTCGCSVEDGNCWPEPSPCECDENGMCEPDGTMVPDHVPTDFGCK